MPGHCPSPGGLGGPPLSLLSAWALVGLMFLGGGGGGCSAQRVVCFSHPSIQNPLRCPEVEAGEGARGASGRSPTIRLSPSLTDSSEWGWGREGACRWWAGPVTSGWSHGSSGLLGQMGVGGALLPFLPLSVSVASPAQHPPPCLHSAT